MLEHDDLERLLRLLAAMQQQQRQAHTRIPLAPHEADVQDAKTCEQAPVALTRLGPTTAELSPRAQDGARHTQRHRATTTLHPPDVLTDEDGRPFAADDVELAYAHVRGAEAGEEEAAGATQAAPAPNEPLPDEVERAYAALDAQRKNGSRRSHARHRSISPAPVPDRAGTGAARLRSLAVFAVLALTTLLALATLLIPSWQDSLFTLVPALAPPLTVTLTPVEQSLSTTLTLTAVTGTPEQSKGQVQARILTATSPVESRTVPTSAEGHTSAQASRGTLTFYNAAPYAQAVAAGTLLSGTDGVQVVTEAPAFVPAGNPPVEGMVSVPAHALTPGPQGNIAPADLDGLCCVAGVSVKNTQSFVGGQFARDYAVVAAQDAEGVTSVLLPSLVQQAQSALMQEVRAGEQVVSATASCTPYATLDHMVGSEAASVTVRMRVTCQEAVYDARAVEGQASTALGIQAQHTLGAAYHLVAQVSTQVIAASTLDGAHGGSASTLAPLALFVEARGTWACGLSAQEVHSLLIQIAGMSVGEARRVLLAQDGIAAVTMSRAWGTLTPTTSLPQDTSRIQVLVLQAGADG